MKNICRLILLVIILCPALSAQQNNDRAHYIGIASGFSSFSIKDALASPVTYSGETWPVQILYRFSGHKNRHFISLSYAGLKHTSGIPKIHGGHYADDIRISFGYSWHRLMYKMLNDECRLYLGGALNGFFSKRDYYYIWDYDETFGELSTFLSISAAGECDLNDRMLFSAQASVPAAGIVYRPPYSGNGGLEGDFSFLEKIYLFNAETAFGYQISGRCSIRFKYQLYYFTYPRPNRIQTGIDNFIVEIYFRI